MVVVVIVVVLGMEFCGDLGEHVLFVNFLELVFLVVTFALAGVFRLGLDSRDVKDSASEETNGGVGEGSGTSVWLGIGVGEEELDVAVVVVVVEAAFKAFLKRCLGV